MGLPIFFTHLEFDLTFYLIFCVSDGLMETLGTVVKLHAGIHAIILILIFEPRGMGINPISPSNVIRDRFTISYVK